MCSKENNCECKLVDSKLEKQAREFTVDLEKVTAKFSVIKNPHPQSEESYAKAMRELKFGTVFTDHMVVVEYEDGKGWLKHRVQPWENFSLSPAAAALHYGQEIFEGVKAFRWEDDSIWCFRPTFNAARFAHSSTRLAMPPLSFEDFLGSIVQLIRIDHKWVPGVQDSSLYIRPFMFATEPYLGVRAASKYQYSVIATPVGPYFKAGLKPVDIYVTTDFHRASPGGTGDAKTAGNYASSLLPQNLGGQKGYEQILYLDAKTNTKIEELGGMNFFAAFTDGSVVTPRLTGTILEGGTRGAILQLLADEGTKVTQDDISLAQLIEESNRGNLKEMFACGTAALVTPIGKLAGDDFVIEARGSELSTKLYNQLYGIQHGTVPDPHGWMLRVL